MSQRVAADHMNLPSGKGVSSETNAAGRRKPSRATGVSVEPRPGTGNLPAGNAVEREPYINTLEVARLLGRSPRSVGRLMSRGLIPYYKFDARVSFRWSEVQAHLAEKYQVCRR